MFEPVALLADMGELIRIVAVLVFLFGGPVLKMLFGGSAKPKPNPIPQRRPPQRPPQQPQVLGKADQLENEIEEFLRRAAGGNPPARQEVVQAEIVQAEVVDPHRRQPQPRRPQPQRAAQPRQRPKTKVKSRAQTQARTQAQTQARTQERAKTKTERTLREQPREDFGDFDDFESDGGGEIRREIDRMESHVHDVFDHQLGSLGESTHSGDDINDRGTDSEVWEGTAARRARARERRDRQAAAMKQMIRDPKSVHQAVIMAEILKRPDF